MMSDGYRQWVEALITLWAPYIASVLRGDLSDWLRDRTSSVSFMSLTSTTDSHYQRVMDSIPDHPGKWTVGKSKPTDAYSLVSGIPSLVGMLLLS